MILLTYVFVQSMRLSIGLIESSKRKNGYAKDLYFLNIIDFNQHHLSNGLLVTCMTYPINYHLLSVAAIVNHSVKQHRLLLSNIC